MKRTKKFPAGTPAELRVREVVFSHTDKAEPRLLDSGETDAAFIRVALPCRVGIPDGVPRRFPNFDFDGNAMVTIYGKERKRGRRAAQ